MERQVRYAVRDREAIIAELQTALQQVADPATYASTGHGEHRLARAALVERAKAMTGLMLFMIEGLIRSAVRAREKGIADPVSCVHNAWLRWLQLHGRAAAVSVPMDGWLVSSFPRRLLSGDEELLGVVGRSRRLGGFEQVIDFCALPPGFVQPAQIFGELTGDPELTRRVESLLANSCRVTGLTPSPVRRLSVSDAVVAHELLVDFATLVSGAHDACWAVRYPGH